MKSINFDRNACRLRRAYRISKKIRLNHEGFYLKINKSNLHFSVQVISAEGMTTVSSSTLQLKLKNNNLDSCKKVAEDLYIKLKEKSILKLSLDRSGYKYHGKIAMLANTLRDRGISI